MLDWAKREVEIACKREAPDRKEGEWDYGCACYESALKAYESLMEDGHSGMSIDFTKNILIRLIEGRPLTPIEDTEDVWEKKSWTHKDVSAVYQCKRMSSLFKHVYPDGTVKYSDNDQCYCVDTVSGYTYGSGYVSRVIEEMFPITMPYMPSGSIKVYCHELLTDRKHGDFDSIGIFYAIKPDGEKVDIHRYFKESDIERGWEEIDEKEWNERETMHEERVRKELNGGK